MRQVLAIEYLNELEYSWKDFNSLSDDQKAAVSIACFAVSEVNALMRIYSYCAHELTGTTAIDYTILIQEHSILRTWSAKLFEFSEFVNFTGKNNSTTDSKLLAIGERQVQKFMALCSADGYAKGYRAARCLRHETTNHYLLSPVRKNLSYVSEEANCNFYMHEINGNSYYPMGDEVVFGARMNREAGRNRSSEEQTEVYRSWYDWNIAATDWLHGVHLELHKELVAPLDERKAPRRRNYWIAPSLVGTPEELKIPVFFRRPA